jgi:hypothetical protein
VIEDRCQATNGESILKKHNRSHAARWLVLGVVATLTGCATNITPKSVADIAKDPAGYLGSDQFSLTATPLSVQESIAALRPGTEGKPLKLRIEQTSRQGDVSHSSTATWTYIPAGRGLIRVMSESSSNGIPYLANFALCFAAVDCLRYQTVRYGNQDLSPLTQALRIEQMDAELQAPKSGVRYVTELTLRRIDGFSKPRKERFDCVAGKSFPAQEVHPKLIGSAVDLECEVRVEDIVRMRKRMKLLLHYGIGLDVERTTSSFVATAIVVDVLEQ